jgi:hypothetical protein
VADQIRASATGSSTAMGEGAEKAIGAFAWAADRGGIN